MEPSLVLASASLTRRRLLDSAGVIFEAVATGVDEGAVKREAKVLEASPDATALRLATLKAKAARRPRDIMIGCDQILVCGGRWFDKPVSRKAAATQLLALRGQTHRLVTAMVVLRGGEEAWRHVCTPLLTMRNFSDAFLKQYLAAEGDGVLSSVGGYRLEGLGIHLFETIEGDHNAILGLALLPLLGFLRALGIVPD